jgi:hypothetical protein
MSHRPPKNDKERLENLLEALSLPEDEDDALDEEIHAELARRGLTMETWAAQFQAQAQAVLDRNRRARRTRAAKIAAVGVAGLAAAAGVAIALPSVRCLVGNASPPQVMRALPLPPEDAGAAAPAGSGPPRAGQAPRRRAPGM